VVAEAQEIALARRVMAERGGAAVTYKYLGDWHGNSTRAAHGKRPGHSRAAHGKRPGHSRPASCRRQTNGNAEALHLLVLALDRLALFLAGRRPAIGPDAAAVGATGPIRRTAVAG